VIARHFPTARDAESPALAVLEQLMQRQLALITDWMLIGFIHGVMNTDNMSISGETIDYGPCAFMDEYDPRTVFSSIDQNGRYAYANQPAIALWNLARFAETLLPLIDPDTKQAVDRATAVLEPFMTRFDAALLAGMRRKIGLATAAEQDAELVRELLATLERSHTDFTLAFRRLSAIPMGQATDAGSGRAAMALDGVRELFSQTSDIERWLRSWQERLAQDSQSPAERAEMMRRANPAFIPRNHRVQAALDAAESGDYDPFRKLLAVLQHPYDDQPEAADYALPPHSSERVLQTFCGT
jgi:uncharacterized protein YdiU (UPF0061 family)